MFVNNKVKLFLYSSDIRVGESLWDMDFNQQNIAYQPL